MFSRIFGFSSTPIIRVNFEDVQYVSRQSNECVLINTLPDNEQDCLIRNTTNSRSEEDTVNRLMETAKSLMDTWIIVYGRNGSDLSVERKATQLQSIGFSRIAIYSGGMLEWLLLQDIYGSAEFPTTMAMIDILRYKGSRQCNIDGNSASSSSSSSSSAMRFLTNH